MQYAFAFKIRNTTFAKKSHKMKKIFASVAVLALMTSAAFAQDSKMADTKMKKTTKTETKKDSNGDMKSTKTETKKEVKADGKKMKSSKTTTTETKATK